ncbi:MCE family protein [Nocardioides terrisoli]|uniref:MCE family protein n=1 Tax=Nocardioides terrisoli TaxID=3388267 RepID=UPI00287B5D9F|nr:MCE family protein [Nocardioides marmorisolisilvae]
MSTKKVRVELTRNALAKRGLVTLLAVALILLLLGAKSKGIIGGPETVSAQVADAGGSLAKGADVKMRGVIIGRVAGLATGPHGGVRIKVSMNSGELGHIPDNVVARILPATVFGTSFLDLTTHGRSASQMLHAGAIIPPDRTQGTLELQQALDDIDGLVKALRPAQLNSTLSSIAMALDGRGAEIGGIIDDLDRLLRKVEPRIPAIRTDLAKLASNLELVRSAAPDLLDGVRDSLGTLHTIAAQKAAIATLLTGGRSVTDEANAFLTKVRPDLVTFLKNASVVEDIYYDLRHQAITQSFATLREVRRKLAQIVHHGWADNTLVIQGQAPPYYTASDCPRYGSARGDNCPGLGRAGVGSMLGGGR